MPATKKTIEKEKIRKKKRFNGKCKCDCGKKNTTSAAINGKQSIKNRSIKEYFNVIDLSMEIYGSFRTTTTNDSHIQTDVSIPYFTRKMKIDNDTNLTSMLTADQATSEYWEILAEQRYDQLCKAEYDKLKLQSTIEDMAEDIIEMQDNNDMFQEPLTPTDTEFMIKLNDHLQE